MLSQIFLPTAMALLLLCRSRWRQRRQGLLLPRNFLLAGVVTALWLLSHNKTWARHHDNGIGRWDRWHDRISIRASWQDWSSAIDRLFSSVQQQDDKRTTPNNRLNLPDLKFPSAVDVVKRMADGSFQVKSAPFEATTTMPEIIVVEPQTPPLPLPPVDLVRRKKRSSKMWPPWPFSLLDSPSDSSSPEEELDEYYYHADDPSSFSLVWSLTRLSARIGLNKARQVSSQLWFHLPPGAPPFLLLALIPQRQRVVLEGAQAAAATAAAATSKTAAAEVTFKRIIPLLSNPFCRNVALAAFGMAIISWGNNELKHNRRLTPLPLDPSYRDLNRVVLPPFLPEEMPGEEMAAATAAAAEEEVTIIDDDDPLLVAQQAGDDDDDDDVVDEESDEEFFSLPPRIKKHWYSTVGMVPKPSDLKSTMSEWKRARAQRKVERQNARRLAIYNELLALQSLKKKARAKQQQKQQKQQQQQQQKQQKQKSSKSSASTSSSTSTTTSSGGGGGGGLLEPSTAKLGYALVTGASRGIGRAIAVELARYEIPLILVARDIDRLSALAFDIEACYGVQCCILQADLSQPHVAESIYNTTRDAGLDVDILVNNAGFSMQGPSFDLPLRRLNDMIQLNAVSAATLTHLYGKEMKRRRRGRILMLSSICGSVAGLPTVSVYAATKAFENSLSLGLAKELEPHGVGVTCVTPGAVRDTQFKARSETEEALCWKLPFYTKTPQSVAYMAVRSTLRGDTESTPGWQNRVFLKVLKPALPQRIHNILAEMAWNPLRLSSLWRKEPSPSYPQQRYSHHRHGRGRSSFWPYFTPDKQDQELPMTDGARGNSEQQPPPHAPIRPPRLPFQYPPPRLLQLKETEPPIVVEPPPIVATPTLKEDEGGVVAAAPTGSEKTGGGGDRKGNETVAQQEDETESVIVEVVPLPAATVPGSAESANSTNAADHRQPPDDEIRNDQRIVEGEEQNQDEKEPDHQQADEPPSELLIPVVNYRYPLLVTKLTEQEEMNAAEATRDSSLSSPPHVLSGAVPVFYNPTDNKDEFRV